MLRIINSLRPMVANLTANKRLVLASSIHTTAKNMGGGDAEFMHRNTVGNNENTPFDFT